VITLTLLHPIQSIPVQSWSFEDQSVIRIGRSTDNNVVLYSAVVSRHHVEVKRVGSTWEVANTGSNGTYIDGKRITKVKVTDGIVIRLASSGPKIQIKVDTPEMLNGAEEAAGRRRKNRLSQISKETLIS
jgi:pSer/pThr/pTyr-binding forkhead associated (FHA) protein